MTPVTALRILACVLLLMPACSGALWDGSSSTSSVAVTAATPVAPPSCKPGYHRERRRCIPDHASIVLEGWWACDRGYAPKGDRCIPEDEARPKPRVLLDERAGKGAGRAR